MGFSFINHPFWGTTILGNPQIPNTHHVLLKILQKTNSLPLSLEHSVMKFLLLGPRALPENSKGAAKTAHIENLSQTISLLNQIPWRLCLDSKYSKFEELGLKSGRRVSKKLARFQLRTCMKNACLLTWPQQSHVKIFPCRFPTNSHHEF